MLWPRTRRPNSSPAEPAASEPAAEAAPADSRIPEHLLQRSKAAKAAKAGGEVSFQVDLAIAETWHLYDHSYAEDPESFFIGVDLGSLGSGTLFGFLHRSEIPLA